MNIASIGRHWHTGGVPLSFPVAFGERHMLHDVGLAQRLVAHEIRKAIAEGATVVCLPGSSVPTHTIDRVPNDILAASRGATVVLETFVSMQRVSKGADGAATRRGWVLRDGEVLRGPVKQLFYSKQSDLPLTVVEAQLRPLVAQIDEGLEAASQRSLTGRVFPLGEGVFGLLLLCGEFNAVAGGHSKQHGVGFEYGLTQAHADLGARWAAMQRVVVFNPTHTRTFQPSVNQKREFLATKGAYIGPTNGYRRYANTKASMCCNITQRRGESVKFQSAGRDEAHGAFMIAHVALP